MQAEINRSHSIKKRVWLNKRSAGSDSSRLLPRVSEYSPGLAWKRPGWTKVRRLLWRVTLASLGVNPKKPPGMREIRHAAKCAFFTLGVNDKKRGGSSVMLLYASRLFAGETHPTMSGRG